MIDAILEILMLQKFTNRNELRLSLMTYGYVLKDRQLRKTVEQMIKDNHYSIASSENGYSLITTKQDLDDAVTYLDNKASAIAIRKNCLLRNFAESKLKCQTDLFTVVAYSQGNPM